MNPESVEKDLERTGCLLVAQTAGRAQLGCLRG